jgi:hypothetical protein
MRMKKNYHNVLKEENAPLRLPMFKNGDGVQQIMPSMPHDEALREWKVQTLEDMRWNENPQHPIKYWCRDIITKTM